MSDARPRSIVLIGPRGAGKTTVGRGLAERLAWTFVDLDDIIHRHAGRTIAELFAEHGESAFRSAEREAIGGLRPDGPAVISVGAGAIEDAENRRHLAALGTVVFLWAAADACRRRVAGDPDSRRSRPDLPQAGGRPEDRDAVRQSLCEQLAACRVDTTNLTPQQAADAVIHRLGLAI